MREYKQKLIKWKRQRARMLALREKGWTYGEIGDKYNCTRECARQLVNKALRDREQEEA